MKLFTKIILLFTTLIVSMASLAYGQEMNDTDVERLAQEYVSPNLISAEAVYKRMKESSVVQAFVSTGQLGAAEASSIQGVDWAWGYGVPNGIDGGIGPMVFDSVGNLYIGGQFRFAGNVEVNNIAKWNGHEWSALGKGVGGTVNTILPLGGDTLLVGGDFEKAGDSTTYHLARWDGRKWSSVCNSFNG
ncbi:MAG: hypothetical protein EPO24_00105, partial [Bacteroidetes bacterium]